MQKPSKGGRWAYDNYLGDNQDENAMAILPCDIMKRLALVAKYDWTWIAEEYQNLYRPIIEA